MSFTIAIAPLCNIIFGAQRYKKSRSFQQQTGKVYVNECQAIIWGL